jgi:hypothetical protein
VGRTKELARAYADCAMLGRTHGQPATPSTMGKELANFAHRLERQQRQFQQVKILGTCGYRCVVWCSADCRLYNPCVLALSFTHFTRQAS